MKLSACLGAEARERNLKNILSAAKERNLGRKTNGNGMGPGGANRKLSCLNARSAVHTCGKTFNLIILFAPLANHRRVLSFFIVQICFGSTDSNSELLLFSPTQCPYPHISYRPSLSSQIHRLHFLNLLLILITTLECLDPSLFSLLLMHLWHSLASLSKTCPEGL